jgi:small subunit ribosomal protein S19
MQINTYSRSSTIFPCFEKMTINIHNGKKFLPLTIQEHHLGSKFGKFVFTRKFVGHKKEGRKVVYKKKKYTPKQNFKNVLITKKKLYNKVKFINLFKVKPKKILKSKSKPMPMYTKFVPISTSTPISKPLAFILNSTMPISKSLAKALGLVPISKTKSKPVKPVASFLKSKSNINSKV